MIILCIITASEVKYIMALKSPVTKESYKQAKVDVESMGGKVEQEFHAAFKAVLISLPSEQANALEAKSYVDFMEQDKSVHIA
ncbi:uncharacterized protein BX663DRAFT_519706 [Cokeromyces recurvatus]|uniref:uncharacterized protein n=1 Tax=Cokeromyces recurvatus TaxID=90255 RepID=UPI00221ED005|nr:uncharacterized protein BX663DRAFT_519706 [Cokeromyces recurvatus]KAI7899851.1 hypothetical protein BX663DRAFT_519706 [Cokeromyces recurvatus]